MLIVGAGPTGLALGIGLRRHGINCCIIDRLEAPSPYSRALGLHARSLEIFEALDVLAPIRKASRRLKAVSVYGDKAVPYKHLRAHEPLEHPESRLLLEKKKKNTTNTSSK